MRSIYTSRIVSCTCTFIFLKLLKKKESQAPNVEDQVDVYNNHGRISGHVLTAPSLLYLLTVIQSYNYRMARTWSIIHPTISLLLVFTFLFYILLINLFRIPSKSYPKEKNISQREKKKKETSVTN